MEREVRKNRGKASKSEKPPSHPLFLRLVKGHDRPLLDAIFSPDGNTIATACEGNRVRLHKALAKPDELDVASAEIDLGSENASVLAFSPDSRTIVAACRGQQRLRYILVGDPPSTKGGRGKKAAGTPVGPVATLTASESSLPVAHTAPLGDLCAAPLGGTEGRWMLLSVVTDGKDMDLHLFSGDQKSKVKKWSVNSGGNNGAALSGDASYAAVATWRTEVPIRALVRSSLTGPVQHLTDAMVLAGHHGSVNAVAFGPAGPMVGSVPIKPLRAYTGSDDGTWAEWDIGVKWTAGESPRLLGRYGAESCDRRPVRHLATSADGRVLACVREGVPRSKRLQEQLTKAAGTATGDRAGKPPAEWPSMLELCGTVGEHAFHEHSEAGGGGRDRSGTGGPAEVGGGGAGSEDEDRVQQYPGAVRIPLEGLGRVKRVRVSPDGHSVILVFVGSGMAKIYKVPKEVRRQLA